jgi:hypothetical protein
VPMGLRPTQGDENGHETKYSRLCEEWERS